MIKGILFDVGGVLIEAPRAEMFRYISEKLEIDVNEYTSFHKTMDYSFSIGKISDKDYWDKVSIHFNVKIPKTKSLWADAYIHAFKPYYRMIAIATQLKNVGYNIGILSNSEDPIVALDIKEFANFDIKVFSCVEGIVKPEPEIYNLALKKLACKPSESIFIDDLTENVKGANAVGIHGILFKNYEQFTKDIIELGVKLK